MICSSGRFSGGCAQASVQMSIASSRAEGAEQRLRLGDDSVTTRSIRVVEQLLIM
jgi:hypothetical protein